MTNTQQLTHSLAQEALMKIWTLHIIYATGQELKIPFDQYEPTESIRAHFVDMFAKYDASTVTHWIAPNA